MPSCCSVTSFEPYELLIEPAAFADLGIRHVLSNGEVINDAELGLRLLGTVSSATSDYDIHVYAVP